MDVGRLSSGRLVLGFDARQENLGEVVGLEFGRGVCLAVFTDQVVFDLAVCVAVAGRELDKLNRRVHGVGRHGVLRAPVDGLRNHVRIDRAAGVDGVAVAQADRAQTVSPSSGVKVSPSRTATSVTSGVLVSLSR